MELSKPFYLSVFESQPDGQPDSVTEWMMMRALPLPIVLRSPAAEPAPSSLPSHTVPAPEVLQGMLIAVNRTLRLAITVAFVEGQTVSDVVIGEPAERWLARWVCEMLLDEFKLADFQPCGGFAFSDLRHQTERNSRPSLRRRV
jgi:hypothetical protein